MFDLTGHHRRRGNSHLRFPILDLRANATALVSCKLYIVNTFHSGICICPIQKTLPANHYPSITCKSKQAKRPQKNSPIFSRHFDGKSLGNLRKTVPKTLQNHAKNMQFLTCFLLPLTVNLTTPPSSIIYPQSSRSIIVAAAPAAKKHAIFWHVFHRAILSRYLTFQPYRTKF